MSRRIFLAALSLSAIAIWTGPVNAQTSEGRRTAANTEELMEAVRAGVQLITLRPGNYRDVRIEGQRPATPIRITAAEGGSPVVIHRLLISDSRNIALDRVTFQPHPEDQSGGALVDVRNSAQIEIRRASLTADGPLTEKRARGVVVEKVEDFLLADSVMEGLERGVIVNGAKRVTIEHNRFTRLGLSALNIVEVSDTTIASNRFGGFRKEAGGTGNFIQGWTRGTSTPTRNLNIRNNVMIQDTDRTTQGIVFSNEDKKPFEKIEIAGNIIILASANGIRLELARNVVVEKNIVLDAVDSTFNNAIRLTKVADGLVSGNLASTFGMLENEKVSSRMNTGVPRLETRARRLLVKRVEDGLAGQGDGRVQGNIFVTREHRASGPRL